MRLLAVTFVSGLILFSSQAEAGCTTRCRPNLFFHERTDCYSDCDSTGTIMPYIGASSLPAGKPPARMRLCGGIPMASGQVMNPEGNWAGMTPATLKAAAAFDKGMFYTIQAAGSPSLFSGFIEMSGFSRTLKANGVLLGTSTAWDLVVGMEVGQFVSDWLWLYGQIGGLMGTRDFSVSNNVPEQRDLLGNEQPLNGSNSGFGYKVGLGADLRMTSNIFLNIAWHYKPSHETYVKDTVGSRLGLELDTTTSVVAAGVSFHAD